MSYWQHFSRAAAIPWSATMSLPPEIIRILSACLVRDESPSNRVLQLMAFCGVCARWREFGRETDEALALDGSSDTQHGPKATLTRFRRASVAHKRNLFLGASRLLTGYSDLTVSGEAVNDQILLNIAVTNGPALTSIKVQAAPHVTDAGLCTLISAAPNLKQFSIEDAGPGVIGHFVPTLLQHCKHLESLLIEGAEALNWAALRLSGAWAAALAAAAAPAPAPDPYDSKACSSRQACQSSSAAGMVGPSAAACMQQQQQLPAAGRPAQGHGGSSSHSSAQQAANSLRDGAGPSSSQQQQQQQASLAELVVHTPRLSSSSSGTSETSTCHEEAISDDGSSSAGSLGAGSDSTSISMPTQAVEALTQQLQHVLAGQDAAPANATGDSSSSSSRLLQGGDGVDAGSSHHHQQQQQRRRGRGGSRPCHNALRRLRVRLANVDTLQHLLECVPGLTELQVDGPALSVQAAAVLCPGLRRVSYLVCSPSELDAVLFCLGGMRNLRALELEVKGMVLSTEQLRVIGMLPLRELALDSHAYRQHPSMPRPQYSHLDNDGVKGLVDSICNRMRTELMPLKLSLCGATALKQEAVSALLRLPILASIDTGGCVKLTPMDRMRLVAKVKAGQGLLDKSGAAVTGTAAGGSGMAALRLPHVL